MADRIDSGHSQEITDRNLLIVAREASGFISIRFIGTLIGLGSNLIFARLLGAELLGVYVLASTTVLFASLLASFGLGYMLVRFVPIALSERDESGAAGIFALSVRTALTTSLLGGLAILLLRGFIAGTMFKEPLLVSILPIAAVTVVPHTFVVLLGPTLRALKKLTFEGFSTEIVYKVALIGGFLAFFAFGLRLRGLMMAFAAANAITALAMLSLVNRTSPRLLRPPRSVPWTRRELFVFSGMMFSVAVMNYIMGITDRFMLGILGSSENVGIYNIAFLISNILATVTMAFNNIFSPIISELYHGRRRSELRALFQSLTRTIIMIVTPAYLWLLAFGDDLLAVFGNDFVEGYPSLVVLGLAALLSCAVGSVSMILAMTGHQKYNVLNTVTVTVLNILLNVFLIPRYGILGAAVATGISLTLVNVVRMLQVRRLLDLVPYTRAYVKPVAAGAVIFALALFLRARTPPLSIWQIIPLLLAFFAVYAGLMAALGIERDDRLIIQRVILKLRPGRGTK